MNSRSSQSAANGADRTSVFQPFKLPRPTLNADLKLRARSGRTWRCARANASSRLGIAIWVAKSGVGGRTLLGSRLLGIALDAARPHFGASPIHRRHTDLPILCLVCYVKYGRQREPVHQRDALTEATVAAARAIADLIPVVDAAFHAVGAGLVGIGADLNLGRLGERV